MLPASPASPHSRLNRDIFFHLQRIKGLRKSTFRGQLPSLPGPPLSLPPLSLQHKLKALCTRRPVFIRPGTFRSSDEVTTVIELGGRLVLPRKRYEQAVELYEGLQTLVRSSKDSDRVEIRSRFSPSPRKIRIRTRVYSPVSASESKSPIESSFRALQSALARPFPRPLSLTPNARNPSPG